MPFQEAERYQEEKSRFQESAAATKLHAQRDAGRFRKPTKLAGRRPRGPTGPMPRVELPQRLVAPPAASQRRKTECLLNSEHVSRSVPHQNLAELPRKRWLSASTPVPFRSIERALPRPSRQRYQRNILKPKCPGNIRRKIHAARPPNLKTNKPRVFTGLKFPADRVWAARAH